MLLAITTLVFLLQLWLVYAHRKNSLVVAFSLSLMTVLIVSMLLQAALYVM